MANYLDFNDLRNEGITHLGNLTGKIWTDYNAHDPGITILEVLCYALLDLDYRSKLPAADIFARDPKLTGPDNNFYTPAQILACNPLTIVDYRKLLSDIEGVRNAWLEAATDQTDACLPENRRKAGYTPLLNGLYHVYIETEDGADPGTVLQCVQQNLTRHRNLCEDVADIIFLGKQGLGVCAIVELDTDADPMQVYLDMMQKLEDFLSPSPHFYTLQELLDKGKSIDAIFAGRPFNTSISHGFIDTDELEGIQLKKEIHLSDLYKALFEVAGISTIRDLQWKPAGGNPKSGWKFSVPQNNAIDFNPQYCGIQFLRNGKPVPFDPTQFNALLQVGMKKNLYLTALPNLDLPYPQGNFRSDLADYYSIQNDFPNVYGISKGGIPINASPARKAWALQLKGFLLFFDQLLADYLAQLAHIRDLFSMGGAGGTAGTGGTGKTYFVNPLLNGDNPDGPNYVPDVDKLWRSYVSDSLTVLLGVDGSTLVYPASPNDLSTAVDYAGWDDLQNVIIQLKSDFETGLAFAQFSAGQPWSYTITTSSPDLVLVSKKSFASLADARSHAAFVLNNGMLDSTYSLFSITGDRFTFTLEYHVTPVADLLQADLEDAALYTRRRQYFLDHLMARFAERFTDYALLQYGPTDPLQKANDQIAVEENYLSQYAVLSSQRGEAGDYTVGKWNTSQISGFEKKWMALVGAGNGGRQSLCNFIVSKSEPEYSFSLKIGDKTFFSPEEKYSSEADAWQSAASLLAAMADRSKYSVRAAAAASVGAAAPANTSSPGVGLASSFAVSLTYGGGYTATLPDRYPTEEYANTIADRLSVLFSQRPSQWDVFASSYMYKMKLADYTGRNSKISAQSYNTADDALKAAESSLANNQVPDPAIWQTASDNSRVPGLLYRNTQKTDALQFIDLDAFKIDINDTIVDKPDKFSYDLLPVNNAFKLQAEDEFDSKDEALVHARELLTMATVPANYWVEEDKAGLCTIWITSAGRRQAGYKTGLLIEEATKQMEKIQEQIRRQLYTVQTGNEPVRWKFRYYLGYEDSSRLSFNSIADYDSPAAALDALRLMWRNGPALHVQQEATGWTLRTDDPVAPAATADPQPSADTAPALLRFQQQIQKATTETTPANYAIVQLDNASQQGDFSWLLADKDHPLAFCTNDYADRNSAEQDRTRLIALLKQGVKFLDICMDGRISRKRKDPVTGVDGYHFLVRCHNYFYTSGKQMILFESVRGYPSEDEAKQAFTDNYISLLESAAKESNYGPVISLNQLISNNPPEDSPLVFVPKETKVALGGADADVIKKLVDMTGAFPIKRAECPSAAADPCLPGVAVADPCATPGMPKKYIYYCGLTIPNPGGTPFEWKGTHSRKTIAEAQLDFATFIRLLRFPGDLFTDTYEPTGKAVTWRIYIHEVLAESAGRFVTEDAAWGSEGVEKFICALRGEGAVLCFQSPDGCSNTFLVNCGPPILEHPCTYSTPKTRDAALGQLISRFAAWDPKIYSVIREAGFLVLPDDKGNPFAKTPITDATKGDVELTTALIAKIYAGDLSGILPYQDGPVSDSFNSELEEFAARYPIVQGSDGRYSVEIKLPAPATTADTQSCYIDWKSTCTFNTGAEAQQTLDAGRALLAHSDYYLAVFTGDCRCFGIALSDPGDKVAVHPQAYTTREAVIEAVARTRKAVNAEGLHLVEHILLRPRSGNSDDCICAGYAYCSSPAECVFPLGVSDPDPCEPVINNSFIPGNDPWSFIATVVLPAWPDKFSSADNRIVLENALYREAPAHVLLRVIWLTPQDCCTFESQYKSWLKAVAAQKKEGKDFSPCDFINYLFTTKFKTPASCQPCHPCPAPAAAADPCSDNLNKSRAKQPPVFSGQVGSLYCWTDNKKL